VVFGVLWAAADAAERRILTVGKQDAPYKSIQAAIDAAPAGAVVRIGPGEYDGGLKIEKPLSLEGTGWKRTTILAPRLSANTIERLGREAMQRLEQAKTTEERNAIGQAFVDQHLPPAILIRNTRGVEIRNLKITCQGIPTQERIHPKGHVVLREAGAKIVGCAILGSSGSGLSLTDGSETEMRESLVAGNWWTGIEIGSRNDHANCRATVADCDLRNCRYAGLTIRKGNDAAIQRCRISGAGWHGIRYDDCSPTILGNRIFANRVSGIYASGKTAATVRQNLLVNNKLSDMSCWFENRDTIAENTFAGRGDTGLSVLGASQPTVERNLFFACKQGISCGPINASGAMAKCMAWPRLKQNAFWQTASPVVGCNGEKPGQAELAMEPQIAVFDPQFVDAEAENFTLAPNSRARRERVGVAEPLRMASPWPLQAEERAIIAEQASRDARPTAKPQAKEAAGRGHPG
jgi:hypothetical protein